MDNYILELKKLCEENNIPLPNKEQEQIVNDFLCEENLAYYKVNACAGSGKTALLTYIIISLCKFKNVKPNEIATLTLNTKVAKELNSRVRKILNLEEENNVAYTFHSFAARRMNTSLGGDLIAGNSYKFSRNLSYQVQSTIDMLYLIDPTFRTHFDNLNILIPKESTTRSTSKYPRNKKLKTKLFDLSISQTNLVRQNNIARNRLKNLKENFAMLRLDYIKKNEISETCYNRILDVANRLFLARIIYDFKIESINNNPQESRGIFKIFYDDAPNNLKKYIIIEVTGDNNTNKFYEDSFLVNYDSGYNWRLFGGNIKNKDEKLEAYLSESLDGNLEFYDLTDLKLEPFLFRSEDEVTTEIIRILERFKNTFDRTLSPENFDALLDSLLFEYKRNISKREQADKKTKKLNLESLAFVLKKIYAATDNFYTYTRLLESAAGCDSTFSLDREKLELKYLFVDEAQDLNVLFSRILKRITTHNPTIQILVVGDRLQAINGFIGANPEVAFGNQIPLFLKGSHSQKEYSLSTTYRMDKNIVDYVNEFTNSQARIFAQKGKILPVNEMKALSSNIGGSFEHIVLDDEKPSIDLVLSKCNTLVAQTLGENPEYTITFLSSKNHIYDNVNLNEFLRRLEASKDTHKKKQIKASTIHRFKGLESDVVVILDANSTNYPNYTQKGYENAFFDVTDDSIYLDGVCLFYVAITRAKHKLYAISSTEETSFLTPK